MSRQIRAVTKPVTIVSFDGKQPMISVNSGVPVNIALEQASCILGVIHEMAISISEIDGVGAEIFGIQYLAEMAKGLVDASVSGVLQQQQGDDHEQP